MCCCTHTSCNMCQNALYTTHLILMNSIPRNLIHNFFPQSILLIKRRSACVRLCVEVLKPRSWEVSEPQLIGPFFFFFFFRPKLPSSTDRGFFFSTLNCRRRLTGFLFCCCVCASVRPMTFRGKTAFVWQGVSTR
jgi:hypothetical protein